MTLKDLLVNSSDNSLSGVKWHTLKQSIVKCLLSIGDATIAELSAELQSSIPTITKAVNELLADGFIMDMGKVANNGGRRPSLYSIAPSSAFFLGIEMGRSSMAIGLQNLKNEFVSLDLQVPFLLENTHESLLKFCAIINKFIDDSPADKSKIVGTCINLSGRINSMEGYSYNYFFNENRPLTEIVAEQIGLPVFLENDTRAMAFGEYMEGVVENEENVLFLNYSWGVGIGIVTNGRLYYGKSGYSGEFGHSSIFDNEILCHCGKIGCLETEVSGWALISQFKKALADGKKSLVELEEASPMVQHHSIISGALVQEDSLCIELITQQSEVIGRYLSVLLNIFNPDLLIIGGDFAKLGDFVLLPIQAALRKHSLGLVNRDMKLKRSVLGNKAGVIGACQIVKEKMLSSLE
ncbi:ROK family transcriptional regulator [Dysgonomonas sp. ZJ279]|uniref:ROK family transcriptional regulator n=1 Tax=Dysgonomonas sp. ZJ279 TaxID=2709796 RepID=UPI0013E9C633|nr:ROK family transcriptional regulator [Dysgonomonas sp. ZJ279]